MKYSKKRVRLVRRPVSSGPVSHTDNEITSSPEPESGVRLLMYSTRAKTSRQLSALFACSEWKELEHGLLSRSVVRWERYNNHLAILRLEKVSRMHETW